MPTWRRFSRRVFESGLYEAQDVLAQTAAVDLIAVEPAPGFGLRERWLKRILNRDPMSLLSAANPGLRPVRLDKDYDLFLAFCQSFEDLLYVNAIGNWRDRCRVSACWIEELWPASLPMYRYWLPLLRRFDHVFVSKMSVARQLSALIGRPVHSVQGAVDVLRFTPYPNPPPLAVDVLSVGRRPEGMHRELRRLVVEQQLFYQHDTFHAALAQAYDPAEHRDLFAATAKRSRYFLVAPPKFDLPLETRGEASIGFRYFEGAAAGAVLLGQRVPIDNFDALFDWPDAVIEARLDGADLEAIFARLNSDPASFETIRRRNATESLRRHDWVHRWREVLEAVGMAATSGMLAREQRMAALADAAEAGWGAGHERLVDSAKYA